MEQDEFVKQREDCEKMAGNSEPLKGLLSSCCGFSEREGVLLKDISNERLLAFIQSAKTGRSHNNKKWALKAYAHYIGDVDREKWISDIKYKSSTKLFYSYDGFWKELMTIRKDVGNSGEICDISSLDSIIIPAILLALGISPEEQAEIKYRDYKDGVITLANRAVPMNEETQKFIDRYLATDEYVILVEGHKAKTVRYSASGMLIKSINNRVISPNGVYKRLHRFEDAFGFGVFEIKTSQYFWTLFKENGYDIDNPVVIRFMDWDDVRAKVSAYSLSHSLNCKDLENYIDTLIQNS